MDFSKMIKATEELLYQIALWLLLIPKTVFKVVTNPSWIPKYMAIEWDKPAGDRFDAYMPPLIFFVIVAILPNIIANSFWPEIPYNDFATRRNVVDKMAHLEQEYRFLSYATMWILLPLSYAFVHQVSSSKEISNSALKPVFYIQCYRLTPLSLVFVARFLVHLRFQPPASQLLVLNASAIVLALAWVLSSEVLVARAELGVSRIRACLLAVVGMVLYGVFVSPVVFVSQNLSR